MFVLSGRGSGVPEGVGCWHGKWQVPKPDCQGEWGGSPSGDGVGGQSVERCPVSKAGCAFLCNVGGVVEGEELDPNPMPFFFLSNFELCF